MKPIFNALICLALASSCKQELCEPSTISDRSAIKISVDWSQSEIDETSINNISIYAYPQDGGLPYLKVSGDITSTNLDLPAGVYSLLIFNDIVGDIAGVNLYGSDSYSTFSAAVVEQSAPSDLYYDFAADETLVYNHEQIAAWRMEEFEVTQNLVRCSYCDTFHNEEILLDVAPTPITTECTITIRIENLNNAQIIQGVVKGFAAGAELASEDRITTSDDTHILYSVNFTSYTYDDTNYIDGVVEAEITTFGRDPDAEQNYEMVIDIILNSGERVSFTRDITEQVAEQDNSKILISLELQENMIVLPEGVGTGFGVDNWGGGESIELL